MPPPPAPGTWGFGGLSTPRPTNPDAPKAPKRHGRSKTPDEDGDDLFMTGGNGNDHGHGDDEADNNREEKTVIELDEDDQERAERARNLNGGLDEDAAYEEAVRESTKEPSVPPENR